MMSQATIHGNPAPPPSGTSAKITPVTASDRGVKAPSIASSTRSIGPAGSVLLMGSSSRQGTASVEGVLGTLVTLRRGAKVMREGRWTSDQVEQLRDRAAHQAGPVGERLDVGLLRDAAE